MRYVIVTGYLLSALLYAMAWLNPAGAFGGDVVQWVKFDRLCLSEFLSVHAATLLGALVLANALPGDQSVSPVFWILLAFYALLAAGALAFHRSNRALLAFFLLLALRAGQFLSLGAPDADAMRSTVLRNFAMSAPMMLLVAGVAMSDKWLVPWQDDFLRPGATAASRLWNGKPLGYVAGYYLLWATVEWMWPSRISQ